MTFRWQLYLRPGIMLSAPLTRHYKADVSAELTTDWHRTRHQDTLAHAATHSLASLIIWCCNHEVMKPFDPDFTFSILPQKQWGDRSINLTQMGVATWAASQYGTCTFIMSWKWASRVWTQWTGTRARLPHDTQRRGLWGNNWGGPRPHSSLWMAVKIFLQHCKNI